MPLIGWIPTGTEGREAGQKGAESGEGSNFLFRFACLSFRSDGYHQWHRGLSLTRSLEPVSLATPKFSDGAITRRVAD